MPIHIGRRLCAHIWETAPPFLARLRANRITAPDASSRRLFASDSSTCQLSSVSRRGIPLTRRFASGSLLVIGVSPSSSAAETSAACINPTKIAAHHAWRRAFHSATVSRQEKSSSGDPSPPKDHDTPRNIRDCERSPSNDSRDSPQYTPPNRHLMDRLPHMPHLHRPTKEELLAAATGFWSRLKVRFKWFSIRSVRPFNLDEITALFSWVLLGHVVWVVVGTTTFFSLLILAINTVFAQGMSNHCVVARLS